MSAAPPFAFLDLLPEMRGEVRRWLSRRARVALARVSKALHGEDAGCLVPLPPAWQALFVQWPRDHAALWRCLSKFEAAGVADWPAFWTCSRVYAGFYEEKTLYSVTMDWAPPRIDGQRERWLHALIGYAASLTMRRGRDSSGTTEHATVSRLREFRAAIPPTRRDRILALVPHLRDVDAWTPILDTDEEALVLCDAVHPGTTPLDVWDALYPRHEPRLVYVDVEPNGSRLRLERVRR
jgi:hypothetical protein